MLLHPGENGAFAEMLVGRPTQFGLERGRKGLCKDGKRDEAQGMAMAYSKEVINSPAMETMRKCTEKMSGAMKGMMPDLSPEKIAKDFSNKHVCDEI